MSDPDTEREYPQPDGEVPSMAPAELYSRLRAGERIRLLDLRNRDEVDAWRIEGPSIEMTHVPYIRFVQAEVTDSVGELLTEHGLDEPVLAVCARGEASAYVAELLYEAGREATHLAGGMEGWARVYVDTAVPHDGPATVRQYYRPSSGCLGYLIAAGGAAVVVDPLRAFVDRYVADAATLDATITHVIDTHVHADHLSGLRSLAERADATPVLPAASRDRGVTYPTEELADGDEIAVGDATLTALHVPGHTTGMTALRVDTGTVLTGDSLFLGSVARPDLEAGDDGAPELAASLHASLHDRLLGLAPDTLIAPGHVPPDARPGADGAFTARLGTLRDRLAVLGLDRTAFVERVLADMPPRPPNHERIIATNLGRADVSEDEAFELELGPNNCAVSA